MLHMNENSPVKKEYSLKRHAFEELGNTPKKMLKIDENNKMSKVRVALFQDKDYGTKLKNLSLSTKSFYNKAERKREDFKSIIRQRLRKRSKSCVSHFKRHTIGGINAGVSHGIKKPKLRSPKLSLDVRKDKNDIQKTVSEEETENIEPTDNITSPEIDLNKRFFKIKRNSQALVTINKNVKLKVAPDGKIALNQKVIRHKKPKVTNISFDASDLTVDEPELEATIEKTEVDNILKLLEDDWGDDDYDTMDLLDKGKNITPLKPTAVFNDVTGSPASELSNTISNLDIKDISRATTSEDILLDSNKNDCQNIPETKYFPLFKKGYTANKFDDIDKKMKHSGKENQWQLSAKLNSSNNQYMLDAGQNNFGATECTECGVIYEIGNPEDENAHLNYHNNKKTLKFPGWKTERIIMEDPLTMSRIILIEPNDSTLSWKKVAEILAYVDRDLGLADTKLSDYNQNSVYLYIRDKAVIGVLVAEHITTAHHMIPELLDLNCCTEENTPAKCGVNVIWTEIKHRKQGIATKLMDILRTSFYFGYVMTLEDIAFSIPTPSGKVFAEKYTKTRNFKVYF